MMCGLHYKGQVFHDKNNIFEGKKTMSEKTLIKHALSKKRLVIVNLGY